MATPVGSHQPGMQQPQLPAEKRNQDAAGITDSTLSRLKRWCADNKQNSPSIPLPEPHLLQRKKSKKWTEGQIQELKDFCGKELENADIIPHEKWQEIAVKIARTSMACQTKASELHFLIPIKKWTDDDIQALQAWCETQLEDADTIPHEKWQEIAVKIARTSMACQTKASELHFLTPKKNWTDDKIQALKAWCETQLEDADTIPDEKWQEIADTTGHTPMSCQAKAYKLHFLIPIKKWTDDKIQALKAWCETQLEDADTIPHEKWQEIAHITDLTPKACKSKASLLHFLTPKKHWTFRDNEQLYLWYKAEYAQNTKIPDAKWEEIANQLGRSANACKHQSSQLDRYWSS